MTPETILRTLLYAAAGSATAAFGGVIAAAGVCRGMCLLRYALVQAGSRGGRWVAMMLASLALVCGVVGQKANTNSSPNGLSAPRPSLTARPESAPYQVVTDEDVARGWRVVDETAGVLAPMPSGAVTNKPLRLRGGFDDVVDVVPPGWTFPWRDGFATGVTVLTRGDVQPNRRTTFFPTPVPGGVSLLPEARWNLVGGPSVFVHALTSSNSLLLAWWNALAGRDANCPTNLQMELFADGRFAWRTDAGTTAYNPVLPFDWDGDGLENSVDLAPRVAGPDAHGTNAEWYKVVCSNVFETVEGDGVPSAVFREGVNTNAYYFIDVVAERGPAPISFMADRDSRLGSPVIVARPGETNHVPLLVGVEYAVTSTVPFEVSLPEGGFAEIVEDRPCDKVIRWPLDFVFEETITSSNRTYAVAATPYDPGGSFAWGHPEPEGPRLMSAPFGGGCGCVSGDGNVVTFNCTPGCTCGRGCVAEGRYTCEAAIFVVTGGICRCGFDDPPPDEPPCGGEAQFGPSLSIGFSKSAVIYEDAYDNDAETHVAKQSTRVRLSVWANGGPLGGTLVLAQENFDKLVPVEGNALSIPGSLSIAPGADYYATCVYEAATHSEMEDDVSLAGYLVENVTGTLVTDQASLTLVELQIVPNMLFPAEYFHRHRFGVCEEVICYSLPKGLMGISWQVSSSVLEGSRDDNIQPFQYLLETGLSILTFSYRSVNYPVRTECIAPSSIVCPGPPGITPGTLDVGHAGGIVMELPLVLCPSNVSFKGIRVMENVTTDGVADGYFTNQYFSSWWNHSHVNGAGRFIEIGPENDLHDTAALDGECPNTTVLGGWRTGSITWTIPIVWRVPKDFSISQGNRSLATEQQRFTIDDLGTVGVEKFHWRALRTVNGATLRSRIQ